MKARIGITDLAYGGRGVGRIDGKAVFVPYTAPGDVAEVEVTAEKKGFSEARLISLLEPSPLRGEPRCPYFLRCGGCQLQHIRYEEQVRLKARTLEETLRRIGGVRAYTCDPPVPSPAWYNYRSRSRFQIKGRAWGFFEAGSNRIVEVDCCPILDERANACYGSIREALKEIQRPLEGLYGMEVGVSPVDGGVAAAFHFVRGWKEGAEALKDALEAIPSLKGYEVWHDPFKKAGGKRVRAEGDTSIRYNIGDISFEASIGAFTQANLVLNPSLVAKAVEYAGLAGNVSAVDLFSGVGNITLPAARRASKATGIESNPASVALARKNAYLNSLGNVEFHREGAYEWLKTRLNTLDKEGADVVILDPPRGGDPGAAELLARLKPRKVVYVSCSPPTLARDLSILAGASFRLERAGLVDMFPQTYHIECVAGLA